MGSVNNKQYVQFLRIELIRKMENDLFDVEIPRLHELKKQLRYGHIAITEQEAVVNLLQEKVSKSIAW